MKEGEVKTTVVYRCHWSKSLYPALAALHAPYQDMLHNNETDGPIDQADEPLREMLHTIGCKDGDEVEIIVRKTGRRPFEGRIWALLAPHRYEQVDGAEYERKAREEYAASDGNVESCDGIG